VRLADIGEINPKNIHNDDQEAGFVPKPLISQEYTAVTASEWHTKLLIE
jgi:hypothetical protein